MPWTILVTGQNDDYHVGLSAGFFWSLTEAKASAGMLESLSLRDCRMCLLTSEGQPIAVDADKYIVVDLRADKYRANNDMSCLSKLSENIREDYMKNEVIVPINEKNVAATAVVDFVDVLNDESLKALYDPDVCGNILFVEVHTGRQKIDTIARLTDDVFATTREVMSIIEYYNRNAAAHRSGPWVVNFWLLSDWSEILKLVDQSPTASLQIMSSAIDDAADRIGSVIAQIHRNTQVSPGYASHI